MDLLLQFDPETDALFVSFRQIEPGGVHATRLLDDHRIVHYDHEGEPVGVEFLWVSDGIDLDGVPAADEIRGALARFPRLVAA